MVQRSVGRELGAGEVLGRERKDVTVEGELVEALL